MLLGSELLPHFGARGGGLTGATWASDGNGRAYNTPTRGSELLVNNSFATWAAGAPTGWALSNAGDSAVTEVASGGGAGTGSIKFTSTTGANRPYVEQSVLTAGKWYDVNTVISAVVSGTLLIRDLSDNLRELIISPGTTRLTGRSGNVLYRAQASSTLPYNITVDSLSLREISFSAMHAATLGTSGTQIAAARINALTTGMQAGTFALVDNPANPQNGIYAYHDVTGVTLDKLVAGTWSNVIARVTVAFAADADLEIRPLGSDQFDLYYGGTKRGATATIAGMTGLYYGLFSTYAGNTFTRFTLSGNVVPFGF